MIRRTLVLSALCSVLALPAAAAPSVVADNHAAAAAKAAKTAIAVNDLPAPVADSIRTHYPHGWVSKAFRVGAGSDVRYEVSVKMQKGVKATKLTLNPDGSVVRTKHKKA